MATSSAPGARFSPATPRATGLLSDDVAEPVWYWLRGPDHVLEGLLAPDASGEAVGLAHVRAWPHPLKGRTMGLLDDLLMQEFNYRGRALYDRYMGAKSDFII